MNSDANESWGDVCQSGLAADGVYLLLTRSSTRIGAFVRGATRSHFNHVSLALVHSSRCSIYSFARRLHCAPFYSGMVKEGSDRLRANVGPNSGDLVMVQVAGADEKEVTARVTSMYRNAAHFQYNTYEAAASMLRRRICIPGAFTCVSFIPFALGINLPKVTTIEDLVRSLDIAPVYIGNAARIESETGLTIEPGETRYWTKWNYWHNAKMTLHNFLLLTLRLAHK